MTSTTTQTEQKDPVQARFLYWAAERENDPSEILDMVNGVCDAQKYITMPVHNVRADLAAINHESHGFQIVNHDSQFLQRYNRKDLSFADFESHTSQYCQELVPVVKAELAARSVVLLTNVFRETSLEAHGPKERAPPVNGNLQPLGKPFHIVHCDWSPPGARASLRAMLPTFFEETNTLDVAGKEERETFWQLRDEILQAEDEAIANSGASNHMTWNGANYQGPRYGMFSVWRPVEPVQRDPLAVLDPNSLFGKISHHDEERKPYMLGRFPPRRRPGYPDEFGYSNMMPLAPRDGDNHKWLWLEDQQPSEVNLIKLFDSEAWKEGSPVMPCAPHSAFSLPNSGSLPPRKSIEMRVLAIW